MATKDLIKEMQECAKRLKDLEKKKKRTERNEEEDGRTLAPIVKAPKKNDAFERTIRIIEALSDDETSEESYDVPEIFVFGRLTVRTDWDDLEYRDRKGYIVEQLSDRNVVSLGRVVFRGLMTTVTRRNVIGLLLLTYNLKDKSGKRMFGVIPKELISIEDIYIDEETDEVIRNVALVDNMTDKVQGDNPTELAYLARGYCFLAASYLRLYTKSVDNYLHLKDHLQNGFKNFYGLELPFLNYHPTGKAVEAVKNQFEKDSMLKHTLYRILYAGKDEETGSEVKDFLYGIHLEITGLHCFGLFMKCMTVMNISNRKLLKLLTTDAFKDELMLIRTLFNNFFSSRTSTRLDMWKYARIFDSSFYSRLQTKHCTMFTASLAHLYHLSVPALNHRNALNIAQLKEMTEENLNYAKGVAVRAWGLHRKSQY